MAYDAVAESLRLIETREIPLVKRLSRRRRHAAMAVDVAEAEGVAVTVFARRSVGCNVEEFHVFARRGDQWTMLGGGGGTLEEGALEDRPQQLDPGPLAVGGGDARIVASDGAGGILDGAGRRWWPRGRWINYCGLQVSAEAARLVVDDREIVVPWHGRCVVVWTGRRRQQVTICDHDGRRLTGVSLDPTG